MSKRKKEEEHVNHERWLVSYADFITLLFAFFVVMYAVSSVNEGKYRVLAQSLISAFHDQPRAMSPIQLGQSSPASTHGISHVTRAGSMAARDHQGQSRVLNRLALHNPVQVPQLHWRNTPILKLGGSSEQQHMTQMTKKLESALKSLVDKHLVVIKRNRFWIDVEINSSVLFKSGSNALSKDAKSVAARVASVLSDFPNRVDVEGFTDNVPISTAKYPSNWELSTARAVSVVHLMIRDGVSPDRLSATGFGAYHPVASNDTAKGRARNRRVALVILARIKVGKGKAENASPGGSPAPVVP